MPRSFLVRAGSMACLALAACAVSLTAQESEETSPDSLGWHRQAVGQLNLTQVSFDNWSEGGENAVAWQTTFASSFAYRAPRYAWESSLKLGYGRSKLGSSDFRKSIDEIRLESVLSRRTKGPISPYVGLLARTQFSTGYKYQDSTRTATSGFFDPAYFTESVGIGYQPTGVLKTRLGAAVKETFTRLYNTYSDNPSTSQVEKHKVEGGITSVTDLNAKLRDDVLLVSTVELFSDLKTLRRTDVNWESTLTVQLAKYVNLNLDVRLLYDSDVSARRQLKQSLALGLSYALLKDPAG
jgi:hypothetical protein